MSQTSSKWGCFTIFMVLILVVSLMLNVVLFIGLKFKPVTKIRTSHRFGESEIVSSSSDNKIVVIDLFGVISYGMEGRHGDSMVDDLLEQLKEARSDKKVKAIILRIDSPGGEVNASDVIYNELRKTRDEYKIPIVAHMMSVAASGGYYAAMGTSHIVANEMTITASVGVIMQSLQYQGLLDKLGLKIHTFKSGKFKDLLSGDREPTAEEKAYVQNFIMETYDKFVGIVARERKLDLNVLKGENGLADGRIMSGPMALKEKFVDRLGYFEDAVEKAKELAGIRNARVIRYSIPFNLERFLGTFGSAKAAPLEVKLQPEMLQLEPGKPYYISSHLFAQ